MPVKILLFSGSVRVGAYSGKTADAVQNELVRQKTEVTRISLADFPLPIIDQNIEKEYGIPENALKLARLFVEHDALVVCTPEYNASFPPLLKNALDWVSRVRKDKDVPIYPFEGKAVAVCSSSPGSFGGIRAGDHLRAVLFHMKMDVIPFGVVVSNAEKAFQENGDFYDERLQNNLFKMCSSLVEISILHSTRILSEAKM